MVKKHSSAYWNDRYQNLQTGWDIGSIATPLKAYFDQLTNKQQKILIPGAGNAYEVEYLYKLGFHNVYLLDFAPLSIDNFKKRFPAFPSAQIICEDFFEHEGQYELIIEHTFFSSLPPGRRSEYVEHMHQLLSSKGRLTGLLFNHIFEFEGPPFGGTQKEYRQLFENYFDIQILDVSYNSIKPRKDQELFFKLVKS